MQHALVTERDACQVQKDFIDSQKATYSVYYESVSIIFEKIYTCRAILVVAIA